MVSRSRILHAGTGRSALHPRFGPDAAACGWRPGAGRAGLAGGDGDDPDRPGSGRAPCRRAAPARSGGGRGRTQCRPHPPRRGRRLAGSGAAAGHDRDAGEGPARRSAARRSGLRSGGQAAVLQHAGGWQRGAPGDAPGRVRGGADALCRCARGAGRCRDPARGPQPRASRAAAGERSRGDGRPADRARPERPRAGPAGPEHGAPHRAGTGPGAPAPCPAGQRRFHFQRLWLSRRSVHRWRCIPPGLDFKGPIGAPIYAAAQGVVRFAGVRSGYGNCVEVDHGHGLVTRYAHMSRIEARVGQRVAPGVEIGRIGSTGRSTGPHLHFEVRIDDRPVDPRPFLETLPDVFKEAGHSGH
ncbi:peptidoglycan DD-metalloendopeptidase family protein [Novosphingobium pokkalii]|uniref:peptidoglycan DD-metalloendopeptidase family protein n=1 Tax=Novosphingobium pokkalii TaxID=1770194 RepID=UPI003642791E